jgi:hypothetical protein
MYLNKTRDMKKFTIIKSSFIVLCLLVLSLASCRKDSNGVFAGKGAPVITSIRTVYKTDSTKAGVITTIDTNGVVSTTVKPASTQVVGFDSTTTSGKLNNTYAIIGQNLGTATKITVNGLSIYFNRALNSDNSIIFTLPQTTPYGPTVSNTIVVTTLYGTVTYKFSVVTPPPLLVSFAPLAGSAGDTLTISGSSLDNVSSVKFGTVPATIVSNTSTQVKVLIPTGVVQAYIYVTTPGGTSETTASFGFKYLIYADALTLYWGGNGGGYSGYNSTIDFENTEHVKRGTDAIKVTFGGSYGAMQIGYGGTTITTASLGLTAVKFSVYGGAGINTGDKLQVVINGNYSGYTITLTAGAYTDYTIPLSALGNPTTISEFVLQGYPVATPSVIYVDDLGFI